MNKNYDKYIALCFGGTLKELEKFFKSEEYINEPIPENKTYFGLHLACLKGHINIVQYLLKTTSNKYIEEALTTACVTKNIELVNYLLTSPETKDYINVNFNHNEPLRAACEAGALNIVTYFLTSKNTKNLINIHDDNDGSFKSACKNSHLDVVKYLIFDINIKKTKAIQLFIEEEPYSHIREMFSIRKKQKTLEKTLCMPKDILKKQKI